MSYLEPPPMPAPVVVVKDVGGLVTDYQARTELYRSQNREVRLHECRSACTLALSLPNVCVYPSSLLKFHQAYNANTKQVDLGVSNELWSAYPQPVREKLGNLTRQYKVLRGSELISLGFRDCNAPKQPQIMIAKARPAPAPEQGGDFLKGVQTAVSGLFGTAPPQQATVRQQVAARPPAAPSGEADAKPPALQVHLEAPLPPPRPPMIGAAPPPPNPRQLPPFLRPIAGSAPILEPHFVPLHVLRARFASATR